MQVNSNKLSITPYTEQLSVRTLWPLTVQLVLQMEELYSLDRELLQALKPVYGLVFLFKWKKEEDLRIPESDYHGKVFFANQVINNACATQAILSVLLNCPDIKLGQELTSFRAFTADFTPDLKGRPLSCLTCCLTDLTSLY